MAKKKQSEGSKKLNALLTAIFTVLAALIYIIFGEDIAGLTEDFDYSKLASIFTTPLPEGEIEVHIIDVGQGDSILIRAAEGNILIDAGTNSSESNLKAHLDACGVDTLTYFICTHPHEDHIGGADMILDRYTVETLLMPDAEAATSTFEKLLDGIESHNVAMEIPEVGDEYTLGDITFKVLAPIGVTDETNDMSIVIKLTYGATSFIFTGDAESPSEKKILDRFTAFELNCDFLKLGHHGSSTSSSKAFLDATSPSIVAISCGVDNDYGHPHREVLERLEDEGVDTILRTDQMGTIVVSSDGREISVKTE